MQPSSGGARNHMRNLLMFLVLLAGCSKPVTELSPSDTQKNVLSDTQKSVFAVVVANLATRERPPAPCFVGADVLISPDFATGDSWRGLGANFDVDEELVASLKMASASKTTFPFPADEKLGANGLVRKIESFELLYYYDGRGDVDAKCVVQFWRPGFSPDGKRCVIRFHYGPTDHGAEGTYVLKLARGEWEIVNSKISIGI
jgi:hypothetical protein